MIDPLSVVIAAVVGNVLRLVQARAEADMLRARAELAQAASQLLPGTEISGTGWGGQWLLRVPAMPGLSGVRDGY